MLFKFLHRKPTNPLAAKARTMNAPDLHLRWMIRADLPRVLEIENASFEDPCTEDELTHFLRQRNCIGRVAELDGEVVGFMFYELHRNRIQITDFAVDPLHRDNSVGTAMADELIGKLSIEGRNRIMLEVRETNTTAQVFFRNRGFRAEAILRDFYDGSTEDAFLFAYRIMPELPPVPVKPTKQAAYVPPNRIAFHYRDK